MVCWHAGMVGPVVASGLCPLQTHFVHSVHVVNGCPSWPAISQSRCSVGLQGSQDWWLHNIKIRSGWSRCLLWNGIGKFTVHVTGFTACYIQTIVTCGLDVFNALCAPWQSINMNKSRKWNRMHVCSCFLFVKSLLESAQLISHNVFFFFHNSVNTVYSQPLFRVIKLSLVLSFRMWENWKGYRWLACSSPCTSFHDFVGLRSFLKSIKLTNIVADFFSLSPGLVGGEKEISRQGHWCVFFVLLMPSLLSLLQRLLTQVKCRSNSS